MRERERGRRGAEMEVITRDEVKYFSWDQRILRLHPHIEDDRVMHFRAPFWVALPFFKPNGIFSYYKLSQVSGIHKVFPCEQTLISEYGTSTIVKVSITFCPLYLSNTSPSFLITYSPLNVIQRKQIGEGFAEYLFTYDCSLLLKTNSFISRHQL